MDNYTSADIGELLNQKDIYLRTSYHCAPLIHDIIGTQGIGTIRVSPGYFNTIEDIETFVSTIKAIDNL